MNPMSDGKTDPLWQALRANPLAVAHWQALSLLYAGSSLPWHARYAHVQAMRCAQVTGVEVAPLPEPKAHVCWAEPADQQLSMSAPWQGLAQATLLLREQSQREPQDWLNWLYLARCLELAGTPQPADTEALRHAARRAVALEVLPGETGHLLAQWRLRAGHPEQAVAALQAVLQQAPQRHGSWLLLAQVQMQLGQEAQAQQAFARAGESRNPAVLSLLADKLFQFNFGQQVMDVREAVTQLQPHQARAWLGLAEIQAKLWQVEKAQASVRRALVLEPDNALAQRWLEDLQASGHSRPQFELELARFESEGLKNNAQGAQRLLMQSLYQANWSADAVADLHRRVGQAMLAQSRQALPKTLAAPNALPWDGQRRLRVGYVSGDLHRQHPVNVFMLPVLQRHDHAALEVFIYQTGSMIDDYTRQARACADHWREAAHLSDGALRQLIIDDRIDVLVDLAGHTATHRLGVFASRAAPVQMSYLGYPHSTGLPCIDWLIADAVVAPPEHAHLFTEQVARVSGSVFCWAPVDEYPLPPDAAAVRSGPVVFGSFNNLLKVDDATIDVWARILRECPDAQLLLKSAVLADPVVQQQTQARFAQAGVAAERLILRGPTELSLMMQEYLEVDVALDPFPYNGGTTSLQALWMGCPLVSLQGNNFVSRMGASFLTHLQRTEWLAHDVDGYVAHALALAQQLRQAPWSRQALRRHMQASGLCQIEQHTREMETIYRQALEASMP